MSYATLRPVHDMRSEDRRKGTTPQTLKLGAVTCADLAKRSHPGPKRGVPNVCKRFHCPFPNVMMVCHECISAARYWSWQHDATCICCDGLAHPESLHILGKGVVTEVPSSLQ